MPKHARYVAINLVIFVALISLSSLVLFLQLRAFSNGIVLVAEETALNFSISSSIHGALDAPKSAIVIDAK